MVGLRRWWSGQANLGDAYIVDQALHAVLYAVCEYGKMASDTYIYANTPLPFASGGGEDVHVLDIVEVLYRHIVSSALFLHFFFVDSIYHYAAGST